MAAALAILAKQRGDVTFVHQSLYYPVTDAAQDTDSYREFADGPFLTAKAMAWFWDAYLPDWERARRDHRVAAAGDPRRPRRPARGVRRSSTRTTCCATRARPTPASSPQAGVRTTSVRYNGTIHDFMMLNPLRGTAATTAAVEQAIHVLRKALGTR